MKTIFTSILIVFSVFAFSQVMEFRATEVSFMYENEKEFTDNTRIDLSVFFDKHKREFMIYTEKVQVYHLSGSEEIIEDGIRTVIANATDRDGKKCIIALSYMDGAAHLMLLIIKKDISVNYLLEKGAYH